MTRSSGEKRRVRAHMAHTGLAFLAARRELDAGPCALCAARPPTHTVDGVELEAGPRLTVPAPPGTQNGVYVVRTEN